MYIRRLYSIFWRNVALAKIDESIHDPPKVKARVRGNSEEKIDSSFRRLDSNSTLSI